MDFLVNMFAILMMSAKLATLGLLKKKVFLNECYDVTIYFDDVTNKILSRDSNYFVDVVMWLKSHNHKRSYHNFNFIRVRPEKTIFLRGSLGSSSII